MQRLEICCVGSLLDTTGRDRLGRDFAGAGVGIFLKPGPGLAKNAGAGPGPGPGFH